MSEQPDHARRRLPGVPLPGFSAFFSERINDAVAMLRFLPDIATNLKAISQYTANMDNDVHLMRVAVERLENEVKLLRTDIEGVGLGLESVGERVERLEPHVADLSRIARPLKRMRSGGRTPERLERPAPPRPPAPTDDEPPLSGLA